MIEDTSATNVLSPENDPPKISDIFRLLCSLEPGLTVKDLCLRNDPNLFGIDERFANIEGANRKYLSLSCELVVMVI